MSIRWWSPGAIFAVTMTSAPGCAAFQMHFGAGKRAAWRANLMACAGWQSSRRTVASQRRGRPDVRDGRRWREVMRAGSERRGSVCACVSCPRVETWSPGRESKRARRWRGSLQSWRGESHAPLLDHHLKLSSLARILCVLPTLPYAQISGQGTVHDVPHGADAHTENGSASDISTARRIALWRQAETARQLLALCGMLMSRDCTRSGQLQMLLHCVPD